jgi:3-hydroxyisobutyrate dehydrogenase
VSRVAVLGLGAMGSRVAANLAAAGRQVIVWNRSSGPTAALAGHAGVLVASSPREAAERADVAMSFVTDDEASRRVWLDGDGALAGLASGAVAVESSTITPAMARHLAAAAADAGVGFLEAPVVGSRPQAEAGALLVLVGGDVEVLDGVRPILEVNAAAVRHVGAVGDAATLKLTVNALFAIQVAAYAEAVGVLARSGIHSAAALDVLDKLPITSPALQRILGLIADRAFAPNFPVRLVAKDLRYLTEVAEELGADTPLAREASSVFTAGASGAEHDLDIAGIALRYL